MLRYFMYQYLLCNYVCHFTVHISGLQTCMGFSKPCFVTQDMYIFLYCLNKIKSNQIYQGVYNQLTRHSGGSGENV